MHLNCIWEIVISKSELEPLLTEVLAFTCLVELFHVLSPKGCKESALLGDLILEFSSAEDTGNVSYSVI